MKNYIQAGVNLTVVAPSTVVSGEAVKVGEIFGVASGDAPIGNNVDVVTEGVFAITKVGAESFAVGDKVFWDATTRFASSDDTDFEIGVAVEAASAGAATVAVKIG